MDKEVLDSYRETRPLIYRDWDWWSWFLGRHYFGAPEESLQWDVLERRIRQDIGLHPGMTILDLGCGSGELVFRLAQRGMQITGIDNSKRLINDCRSIAAEQGIAAQFLHVDMFDYAPETTFDAIICINTSFGYGTDKEHCQLLYKTAQWLKPHGRLYLDLIVADNATAFGIWSDYLNDGTLIVDNVYNAPEQQMISWPHWLPPDEGSMICSETPEQVRLYLTSEIESMLTEAGYTTKLLTVGAGQRSRNSGSNATRTWLAQIGN